MLQVFYKGHVLDSTAKIGRIDCSCEHPTIYAAKGFLNLILMYSTAKLLD